MLRQYHAQRYQPWFPAIAETIGKGKRAKTVYRSRPDDLGRLHRVGTVPIGTTVYIQDDHRPLGGGMSALQFRPRRDCCKNPWVVIAWLNREYFPAVQGARAVTYMTGGHLALVKSLRDGRVKQVSDWILLQCVEAGLTKD